MDSAWLRVVVRKSKQGDAALAISEAQDPVIGGSAVLLWRFVVGYGAYMDS